MLALAWFLIIATIAVNALYVAAEFAAVSVRHSRIRTLADEGSYLAQRLLPMIEDGVSLDRFVACCQIGITFSSLLLGAVAQATLTLQLAPWLAQWFSLPGPTALSVAALLVLLLLTAAQMVVGELAPKSLALQYPTQTALATVIPMAWSLRVLGGFVAVLNGSGSLILQLFGVRGGGHGHIHSPEEIELLIVESRDGGLLEPEEQHRLHQALRLSQRPVSQLMVARLHMVTVSIDTPPDAVLNHVAESPYSRFPVIQGSKDNVVGVLYSKDVIAQYIDQGTLGELESLVRPILNAPRNLTADRLLALFREHRCEQAILVDEYGGVEGLVTLEDVLTEVFGEFADEFKQPERGPEQFEDGRVQAPGLTRLVELETLLGIRFSGNAATIGGLVLNTLGRLPVVGDRITIDEVEIEVQSLNGRAVKSVLLSPRQEPQEPEAS